MLVEELLVELPAAGMAEDVTLVVAGARAGSAVGAKLAGATLINRSEPELPRAASRSLASTAFDLL